MTTDQYHIRMPFGDASGNSADTGFRYQFDTDTSAMIGILQVVNQLRQIFN